MGEFWEGKGSLPTAKTYGSVSKEAIESLIKSMGDMYASDSVYTKLFNALNRAEESESLKQYNQDLWNQQLNSIGQNRAYASAILNYQTAYGSQTLKNQLEQLKASDPEFWAQYEQQGKQVLEDLAKGSSMTDAQIRNVEQITRASQIQRGNAYGNASAAQEVYNKFMAGENLYAQRQKAAQNFLQSSPYNSWNIGSITAYQPQTATNGYSVLTPYAMANANNVSGNAANYEMNNYRAKMGWEMIEANQPSQFVGMIGGATQGAAIGGLTGGWVGAIIGGISGGVMGALSK